MALLRRLSLLSAGLPVLIAVSSLSGCSGGGATEVTIDPAVARKNKADTQKQMLEPIAPSKPGRPTSKKPAPAGNDI